MHFRCHTSSRDRQSIKNSPLLSVSTRGCLYLSGFNPLTSAPEFVTSKGNPHAKARARRWAQSRNVHTAGRLPHSSRSHLDEHTLLACFLPISPRHPAGQNLPANLVQMELPTSDKYRPQRVPKQTACTRPDHKPSPLFQPTRHGPSWTPKQLEFAPARNAQDVRTPRHRYSQRHRENHARR